MKARIVEQYVAKLPAELDGLTQENFSQYMNWRGAYTQLDKRVSSAFKPTVYEMTGFDDDHRPGEETDQVFDIGGLKFKVTTKPTTKRPSYRDVTVELENYLGVLDDQYSRDIRRKEVITINGEPYVSVADVQERIDYDLGEYTSGCEGVSHSIVPVAPEDVVIATPDSLPIQFRRDYGKATDFNARAYISAENMKKKGNKRANAFKKQVLEESLSVGEPDGSILVVEYAFDDWDIVHQVEERKTPKYKDVIEAFTREAPDRLTKRSKVGDLVLADALVNGCADGFRDKEILTLEFEQDYAPAKRGDRTFVRLAGIQERLDHYVDKLATVGKEQNFAVVMK